MGIRVLDVRCSGSARREEEVAAAHQIILVRRGVFHRRDRRGRVVADPAAVIFVTAGAPYEVEHPVAGGDRCTVLLLDDAVRRELLHDQVSIGGRAAEDPPGGRLASGRTHLLHRQLLRCVARPAFDTLAVEELSLSLARAALQAGERLGKRVASQARRATLDAHEALVSRVRTELASAPFARVSLATLSRRAGASPFHLCRVFRRSSGMPIHQYRLRLRLIGALERLLESSGDLTGVALDTGFSSHSHFTTAFVRQFGVPPSRAERMSEIHAFGEIPAMCSRRRG